MLSWLMDWFWQNLYLAVFLGTLAEGAGLPLPAELLFLAALPVIDGGDATPGAVLATAALGNLTGALLGFTLAYTAGRPLLVRVMGLLRVRPDALERLETFLARYGPATVFVSRFVGAIRVAAIYTAGAARMSPLVFAFYTACAALMWNGAWLWLALRFGPHLKEILHRLFVQGLPVVLSLGAVIVAVVLLRRGRMRI